MVNLVFETTNVLKLFETPYVYFKTPSGFRDRGVMQVERGRMEEGRGFFAPAQSPTLQRKAEIFVFR